MPFVRRTRATLRSAAFGFFGVVVYTRTQTPRRCGHALSAGEFVFHRCALRPNFTSWLIVGIRSGPRERRNATYPGIPRRRRGWIIGSVTRMSTTSYGLFEVVLLACWPSLTVGYRAPTGLA